MKSSILQTKSSLRNSCSSDGERLYGSLTAIRGKAERSRNGRLIHGQKHWQIRIMAGLFFAAMAVLAGPVPGEAAGIEREVSEDGTSAGTIDEIMEPQRKKAVSATSAETISETLEPQRKEAVSTTSAETDSDRVVVCILDSGYTAQEATAGEIRGWNYLEDSADFSDEQGHGTDICTLVAENAPDAELIMLKCFEGETVSDGEAIAAALYAAVDDYQADVINMSWTIGEADEELYEAICYASEQGAVLVASAGNLSLATGIGSEVYPALWDEVIGVGGVDLDEDGSPVSSLWYLSGEAVYICARGDYGEGKGSSYAAARISGMAASWLAEHPDADADAVRQMLRDCAQDVGEEGYDTTYGWGYVATEGQDSIKS